MGVILPGVERDGDFPPVFSWDWDGTRFFSVGVGRERFENPLPCHPLECTQPPYNDKNPPSVFFVISLNVFPFLKSSRLSVWRHTDGGPSHDCLIDSSVLAQTTLVSYLIPALCELSSVVSLPEQQM